MKARDLMLERFSALSPTLQAAARFVVDHPNEVVIASMRTLAERAGAQPATLVRLAQQLGYSGWPALKSAFAEDLGLHAEGYGQRAQSLAARGGDADLLGEMFAVQRNNLALTEAQCAASLHEAARALKRGRAVHVAGFRASFPVAYSLVYGYRLFRDSVHLIDGQSGGLEMQLRPIARQDVVVAISFAPYSREVLAVVAAAQAAGARIVALTDSHASPLALAAEVTVLFSVASPSFFPSVAAAVAVTEALLELLVADAGAGVAQQIERTEQHLFDSGAYLRAPGKA
ncbi:MurR/RpiR family transcriptional regulator [Xylophilus sp. GW821-FHT01B05]